MLHNQAPKYSSNASGDSLDMWHTPIPLCVPTYGDYGLISSTPEGGLSRRSFRSYWLVPSTDLSPLGQILHGAGW